jgi:hypothetical protein
VLVHKIIDDEGCASSKTTADFMPEPRMKPHPATFGDMNWKDLMKRFFTTAQQILFVKRRLNFIPMHLKTSYNYFFFGTEIHSL